MTGRSAGRGKYLHENSKFFLVNSFKFIFLILKETLNGTLSALYAKKMYNSRVQKFVRATKLNFQSVFFKELFDQLMLDDVIPDETSLFGSFTGLRRPTLNETIFIIFSFENI